MTLKFMTQKERTAFGVGLALHNALLNAGHEEWHRFHTHYDLYNDEIIVRFYRGLDKLECMDFRIPHFVSDPVEYATAKWPEWFTKRQQIEQQLEFDL